MECSLAPFHLLLPIKHKASLPYPSNTCKRITLKIASSYFSILRIDHINHLSIEFTKDVLIRTPESI